MVVLSTSHKFDQVTLEFEFGTSTMKITGVWKIWNLESGIWNRETETETRLEI